MYLRAMYLYNVTIIAEDDISEVVKQHLHTELFSTPNAALALSLLELQDSPHEGTTLCIQLRCAERADIAAFQAGRLAAVQTGLAGQYPGKVVFFDSIMKYLSE